MPLFGSATLEPEVRGFVPMTLSCSPSACSPMTCSLPSAASDNGATKEEVCVRPLTVEDLRDRLRAALWGLFIADALAMPVHWYYNTDTLRKQYGFVTDYVDPQPYNPDSFLHLSDPEANGSRPGPGTVGIVILHDKLPYWRQKNTHYHLTLKKGENTLNAQCARVVMQTVLEHGVYDAGDFLENYIDFMVTPGTHNDSYAESFHRSFFRNFSQGINPFHCAGRPDHNTPSIGGLVMLVVVALVHHYDIQLAKQKVVEHLRLTHQSRELEVAAEAYVEALIRVLYGADLRKEGARTCRKAAGVPLDQVWSVEGVSDEEVVHDLGKGCHITAALPSLLYIAGKHSDSLEAALISNANCGGSSCHRGAALGALMGAHLGSTSIPKRWIEGLKAKEELQSEIEEFVALVTAQHNAPLLAARGDF
eukprot:comp15185_c1_seq1/m.11909 comp15185_c1_seq1/g.11909  ORF comp15185_c1_seq1/g.11909 comp15185_c1_seq1/m.11909 type:complete len:421 (-) comp15185_c1_seq1:246-1508(-)